MEMRKFPLISGEYYHIYSRSIAKYVIFNDQEDYNRIIELLSLYRFSDFNHKYSAFKNLNLINQKAITGSLKKQSNLLVEIVAYCIMPTHIHLILKQIEDNGVSGYISKVLNSYTRYFNIKHHRNGPLWESHFKNVLIETDEYLLHLSRYIHLNPCSALLKDKPQDWHYSSYHEYIDTENYNNLCQFKTLYDMDSKQYKKFVDDRKSYQKELSKIKHLLIDDYSG